MKKMIVAGLLALMLAVAPGVAFGAATAPLLPAADAPACAGCATGLHRVACPTTIAQSLFATIDHCANRVHGCLGMSGTANTDDRVDDASDGWTCPRSGHHGYGHGCGNGAGHGCRR